MHYCAVSGRGSFSIAHDHRAVVVPLSTRENDAIDTHFAAEQQFEVAL